MKEILPNLIKLDLKRLDLDAKSCKNKTLSRFKSHFIRLMKYCCLCYGFHHILNAYLPKYSYVGIVMRITIENIVLWPPF